MYVDDMSMCSLIEQSVTSCLNMTQMKPGQSPPPVPITHNRSIFLDSTLGTETNSRETVYGLISVPRESYGVM